MVHLKDRAAFHINVFCAAFLYLQLGFVIFWQNEINASAARNKLLVKLTRTYLASLVGGFHREPTSSFPGLNSSENIVFNHKYSSRIM